MKHGFYFFIVIIGALLIGFICRYLEVKSGTISTIGIIYTLLVGRIYRVQFLDRGKRN
jgi:hypothetical protein